MYWCCFLTCGIKLGLLKINSLSPLPPPPFFLLFFFVFSFFPSTVNQGWKQIWLTGTWSLLHLAEATFTYVQPQLFGGWLGTRNLLQVTQLTFSRSCGGQLGTQNLLQMTWLTFSRNCWWTASDMKSTADDLTNIQPQLFGGMPGTWNLLQMTWLTFSHNCVVDDLEHEVKVDG